MIQFMRERDALHVRGHILIRENGKLVSEYDNLFLDAGKEKLFNILAGLDNGNETYSYFVIGDGTTEPTGSDTKLANQKFRKQITDRYVINGVLSIICFVENTEANFQWKEIGLEFGGNAQYPGVLFNRALIDEDKNDMKQVEIEWQISIV